MAKKAAKKVAKKAAAKPAVKKAVKKSAPPAPSGKPASGGGPASYHAGSPEWGRVDAALRERIAALPRQKALHERAMKIADLLQAEFPDATCALTHENALQLTVATILSAQCTDERVNMVTPGLFAKYPTAEDLANAPEGELEEVIRSTGFFNSKAKSIRECCRGIVERFGGEVPEAMEDLLTLRGVARKTANVVRTNIWKYPGLTVDTHFLRLTARLGLTTNEDPEKVEADVANLLPPERWAHFCHSIILHGRKTCKARKPNCDECRLVQLCPAAFKA